MHIFNRKKKLQTIYNFLLSITIIKIHRSGNYPVYQLNHDHQFHSVRTIRAGSIIRVTLLRLSSCICICFTYTVCPNFVHRTHPVVCN